jgi:hypothetical protein
MQLTARNKLFLDINAHEMKPLSCEGRLYSSIYVYAFLIKLGYVDDLIQDEGLTISGWPFCCQSNWIEGIIVTHYLLIFHFPLRKSSPQILSAVLSLP